MGYQISPGIGLQQPGTLHERIQMELSTYPLELQSMTPQKLLHLR
jgi:hypothetical protein